MIRATMVISLLCLATACGDKAGGGASSGASASATAATSSAATPAKPKGKAGSAVAVVGKKTYEVEFDVGYVDRFSGHAAIVLFAECPSMTCEDVGSHKDWVKKCPKGKKVVVQIDGVKDTDTIPTGALAKPKVWVRWMPDPDHQDDLFFDNGFEITKSESTTVAGKFSIEYKADPGGTSSMTQEGGSLKGDFVAQTCPR